jgi:hypothetical protein
MEDLQCKYISLYTKIHQHLNSQIHISVEYFVCYKILVSPDSGDILN